MMNFRRIIAACIATALCAVALADGEKYTLKEQYAKDDIRTVNTQTQMKMELKLISGGVGRKIPYRYKGVNTYVEKVLAADKDGKPEKVARHYEKSTMETEKAEGSPETKPTAFEDKTYIIEKTADGVKAGGLDGGEVPEAQQKELATAVESSHDKVLPGKEVEPGDTWDVPLEAVREIYSINQETTGSAKALFSGIEKYEGVKSAVIKVEVEISYTEGAMTLKYKGSGKVYFALAEKKIVGLDFTAKIEVSGSQKKGQMEIKYGGGGTCSSRYKAKLAEGEINLTPPKKDEEKKEEKKENNKQEKEPAEKDKNNKNSFPSPAVHGGGS